MDTDTEVLKLVVQAHIADYQVIASRISRFTSLQFIPVPALGAFLTVVVGTHKLFDPILVAWGTAGVVQFGVLTYYFALYEVYNHVRYLETKLKPMVANLLKVEPESFWGYEKYLKKTGKGNDPLFGDVGPVFVSFLAVLLAALSRIPPSGWDYFGSVVNGFLLILNVTSVIRVVKVRRGFTVAA
jgi:hypothetical protein